MFDLQSIQTLTDISLHDHSIERKKPIVSALPAIIYNRNREFCLLQSMLYFYYQLLIENLKSSPNILRTRCFYRKWIILSGVLVGKQSLMIYYDVSSFPLLQMLWSFVHHPLAVNVTQTYIKVFVVNVNWPLNIITLVSKLAAD